MKKFKSLLVVLLLMSASFTANAQEYPRGDVDRDGVVSISDVTSLINNLLKGVREGDVDQDGTVSISDVTCLIDYLLKGSWPDEPVTPPDNHEWVDLGLPSGTLWATMNVGASSSEEYGDYFAWGETSPKDVYAWNNYKWCNGSYKTLTKYCTSSSYGTVDNKTELDPEDDAAYVNWGSSWRVPTKEQQEELQNNCTWTWTRRNGVNGYEVAGSNGNTLFLPAAGCRDNSTSYDVGSYGYYWSRTLFLDRSFYAYYLVFNARDVDCHSYHRYQGFTVRAVRLSQN